MNRDAFEYEVALSFASQDRSTAEEVAALLAGRNIRVFLDEYRGDEPWSKDVVDHLVNLYARKARYCVLLVSRHYPLGSWTQQERAAVGERSLRDADEYILPVRLDDRDLPGAWDLRQGSPESLAALLEEKILRNRRKQVGPPAQSHDLRSGNVPPARDRNG